jgi:Dolichyl-phosphate-mannose-protein mannosyltransferase
MKRFWDHRQYALAGAVVLAGIAVIRIACTYPMTAQAFDEPCHVSAALELLEKDTYTLDPYNTPLARITIGLPLVLAGERYPQLPDSDPRSHNYNYVGNVILYQGGHYMRNLILARSGVLPLFLLMVAVVFVWARREFGDLAALVAVGLVTTLPPILAFASIAYSDMAAAFAQAAALFAFVIWLEQPSLKTSAWLGATIALALLSKFTTLLYLPAAVIVIVSYRWAMRRRAPQSEKKSYWPRHVGIGLAVLVVVWWAGYGFSVGRVQETMQLSPQAMPTFHHFPRFVRPIARRVVLADPFVPAPGLLRGLASSYAFNRAGPPSYLFGQIKQGGWWYFFLLDIALKSPLPFLVLSLIGFVFLARGMRQLEWSRMAPGLAAIAILAASTRVNVNYGVRHIIVLFPLLAMVAGFGAASLWRLEGGWRIPGRLMLIALLAGQLISTAAARHDYIAYFNVLAGRDPSRIFVRGCDLDCGQDLFRLSDELLARHIDHIALALWTSADMDQTPLPAYTVPEPYQPVSGWFAISLRALRTGAVFHKKYPQDGFAWLDRYQPVEHIGKTILLYYIPEQPQKQ